MRKVLIIFLLVGLFAMVAVAADFEEKISIQGRLTSTDGSPRVNETVTLKFTLYADEEKNYPMHSETQSNIETDNNGIFNTEIGKEEFLNSHVGPASYINFEEQYWLEIKEGDNVIGFSPLRAAAYAITARNVAGGKVFAESLATNLDVAGLPIAFKVDYFTVPYILGPDYFKRDDLPAGRIPLGFHVTYKVSGQYREYHRGTNIYYGEDNQKAYIQVELDGTFDADSTANVMMFYYDSE